MPATPHGVTSPTAMFGSSENEATYGRSLTGGATRPGVRTTFSARRAARRPTARSGSGRSPWAEIRPQLPSARTRAAASASRSSASRPARTPATMASRSNSTVSSSASPPPTQIASAPAARASTVPSPIPKVSAMAPISIASLTIRPW